MITTTTRRYINITLIEILHHTLTILCYQEDETILNKKKNCCSISFSQLFFGLLILALEFQLPFHFQI